MNQAHEWETQRETPPGNGSHVSPAFPTPIEGVSQRFPAFPDSGVAFPPLRSIERRRETRGNGNRRQQALINTGRITEQGIGRRAHIRTCPTCKQPTLTGLDADRCALTATVDPYPLTPHGEVWALSDGRHTYQLQHGQLEPRTRWNIPGHPPGPDHTVLTTHRCHQPIPTQHRRPPAPRPAPPTPTEEIPF